MICVISMIWEHSPEALLSLSFHKITFFIRLLINSFWKFTVKLKKKIVFNRPITRTASVKIKRYILLFCRILTVLSFSHFNSIQLKQQFETERLQRRWRCFRQPNLSIVFCQSNDSCWWPILVRLLWYKIYYTKENWEFEKIDPRPPFVGLHKYIKAA